jgi:predicted transcriptional regulator
MHKSQSLLYLTTVLHVSGVTITHLQEHKTTVTTESGNRYTVLLPAAIVEELELISSNSSTIAADNSTV